MNVLNELNTIFQGKKTYESRDTEELLDLCLQRQNEQIMAQEILAIALGLCTFKDKFAGRCVRIWTDNAGSECVLKCGGARASDHNLWVHSIWLMAARNGHGIWIERAPTKLNISDLPSRESHELLQQLGAVWLKPVLDKALWRPAAWQNAALSM